MVYPSAGCKQTFCTSCVNKGHMLPCRRHPDIYRLPGHDCQQCLVEDKDKDKLGKDGKRSGGEGGQGGDGKGGGWKRRTRQEGEWGKRGEGEWGKGGQGTEGPQGLGGEGLWRIRLTPLKLS